LISISFSFLDAENVYTDLYTPSVIYTTNAVESLHMSLRKIIKTRGSFPSEEAAMKLLYLALRNVIAKWETIQHWKAALNHFQILWGERIQTALNR
jgi:transposase-like protein